MKCCQTEAVALCAYSSSGEACESSPLCTLRWRLRLETTEKWRPHPSTSHANAVMKLANDSFTFLW